MVDIDELISVIMLRSLDGTVAPLDSEECDVIIEALEFYRDEYAGK